MPELKGKNVAQNEGPQCVFQWNRDSALLTHYRTTENFLFILSHCPMAFPGKLHLLRLLLVLVLPIIMLPSPSHQAQDPRLTDRIVRDSAFKSYHAKHHKTAILYNLSLPPSLSGVAAETVRYRAGSLRRYGATIGEFRVASGIFVHPHIKRLIVVRQNLGNLSSMYNGYGNMSGFQLVSPVLGLLFYNATSLHSPPSKNLSELHILVNKEPIAVDFSGIVLGGDILQHLRPLCAVFELDGNVSLSNQMASNVCVSRQQGHFALVVERNNKSDGVEEKAKVSEWKVVVVSVVAAVFGAVLLGLIAVAVASARRKRYQREEMERRAYEEEALQISMVGHVRAPTAALARTEPTLENNYVPPAL